MGVFVGFKYLVQYINAFFEIGIMRIWAFAWQVNWYKYDVLLSWKFDTLNSLISYFERCNITVVLCAIGSLRLHILVAFGTARYDHLNQLIYQLHYSLDEFYVMISTFFCYDNLDSQIWGVSANFKPYKNYWFRDSSQIYFWKWVSRWHINQHGVRFSRNHFTSDTQ
jgi:hypothetical protein